MSDGSKQQHLYESLSALVDNEASELELHRILSESERDPSVRARWHRYQLARTAMKGEVAVAGVDISDAVRDAVLGLDVSDQQQTVRGHSELNQSQEERDSLSVGAPGTAVLESSKSSWKANVARFAIAASVASVVLLSSQQFNLLGSGSDPSFVASNKDVRFETTNIAETLVADTVDAVPHNSPFAVVDLQNVAGTFNSLASPQQNRLPQQSMSYSPTIQQKQLQDERVRLYIQQLMLEHATNTAQHSGAGLLPYSRVPVEVNR
ncbi:MAG: sigma-E factor negative regulatory protein [Cellvibrionaceae bacterium]